MKLDSEGETLRISDVPELGAATAGTFRDEVRDALGKAQRFIEIDLSQTGFIDSCGLGALVALHKTACARKGGLRLLRPNPPVLQILELTRMHRLFEIVKS